MWFKHGKLKNFSNNKCSSGEKKFTSKTQISHSSLKINYFSSNSQLLERKANLLESLLTESISSPPARRGPQRRGCWGVQRPAACFSPENCDRTSSERWRRCGAATAGCWGLSPADTGRSEGQVNGCWSSTLSHKLRSLTLFSSSSLTLTERSSRTFSYLSLWIWKVCWACSSLGKVLASRGPMFSSSRSTRYASYSILDIRA